MLPWLRSSPLRVGLLAVLGVAPLAGAAFMAPRFGSGVAIASPPPAPDVSPGATPAQAAAERAAAPAAGASATGAAGRPDVVVILTDDQKWGSEQYMTQVQQELAARGVTFANAHAPTSTCCPSRSSLFTGRLSKDTGVWTNWAPYGGFDAFYPSHQESDTIATRLSAVGYRTALIGKYLNGYGDGPNRLALTGDEAYRPPGWDTWHVFARPGSQVGSSPPEAYYDYWLMDHEGDGPTTFSYHGRDSADYSTTVLGGQAREFIRSTPASVPLLLVYTPFGPHAPYSTNATYKGAAVPEPDYLPPGFADAQGKPPWVAARDEVTRAKAASTRAQQFRALYPVDDEVGGLVQALEDTGRLDNTLLVFASDNGYTWGEFNINGSKNYPYTTPVPMIVRWDAGGLTGGRVDKRLVANIDITKTALAAAGADVSGMPDALDLSQRSATRPGLLISAWRNRGGPSEQRMPAYCGWRTDRWLYVRYAQDRFEELYRVSTDPAMLDNRAVAPTPQEQQVLERLRAITFEQCSPQPPGFSWDPVGSSAVAGPAGRG